MCFDKLHCTIHIKFVWRHKRFRKLMFCINLFWTKNTVCIWIVNVFKQLPCISQLSSYLLACVPKRTKTKTEKQTKKYNWLQQSTVYIGTCKYTIAPYNMRMILLGYIYLYHVSQGTMICLPISSILHYWNLISRNNLQCWWSNCEGQGLLECTYQHG